MSTCFLEVNEFAFLVVLVACSCSSPAATEDWSVKVNFGAFPFPFLHMSSSIHTTFPFPFLHMTITCFLHISSCNPPAYLLHNCGNLQGIHGPRRMLAPPPLTSEFIGMASYAPASFHDLFDDDVESDGASISDVVAPSHSLSPEYAMADAPGQPPVVSESL